MTNTEDTQLAVMQPSTLDGPSASPAAGPSSTAPGLPTSQIAPATNIPSAATNVANQPTTTNPAAPISVQSNLLLGSVCCTDSTEMFLQAPLTGTVTQFNSQSDHVPDDRWCQIEALSLGQRQCSVGGASRSSPLPLQQYLSDDTGSQAIKLCRPKVSASAANGDHTA